MLLRWLSNDSKYTLLCVALSVPPLLMSLFGWGAFLPVDPAWAAILLCGVPILFGAGRGLIFDHDIKADVLVSLALLASLAVGEYFAAGEVAFIMQLGTLLEDYTAARANAGLEKLVDMTPRTARVTREGKEVTVSAETVTVGEILMVLAGETIPLDGTILSGRTTVDTSVMTGESLPVEKGPGDAVMSGTVNQYGTFTMRADKICEDSALQRMIRLAKEAEAEKAPIIRLADRWATWLVVIALGCAVLTWLGTGIFLRAVTVLVVFCPCAFILATPTAVMAGLANAARHGILVRSGEALERLAQVEWAAFDKTGTLTEGEPKVVEVVSLSSAFNEAAVERWAAIAERRSEHPLGRAIAAAFLADETAVEDFELFAGRGVRAVAQGHTIWVGTFNFLAEQGISAAMAEEAALPYQAQGATVVGVAVDDVLCGIIALADTMRSAAPQVLTKLKTAGITPLLLTGDSEAPARAIAVQAGIDEVRYSLLPEDKQAVVRAFTEQGKRLAMIGDGVNDALALKNAYAGIAMGGIGSDIAVESADAVLVEDDIRRLPYLFALMKKVIGNIRQNIILSLLINFSAVLLSAFGLLNPVTGALVHNGGSVLVVVNAARLLRERDEN